MDFPGRLPSLPALRAFEAAARLGSVAAAAGELFVTPGAVSHQINGLEAQLGYALFVRQGRGIALTPEGRRLAEVVNRLLVGVGRELDALRRERERPRLVVTVLPSFSARWLTPRLGRFIEHHPDIELWVQTSKQVESLAEAGIDLAIRMGAGQWRGVHAQPFLREHFLVVASPTLAGGLPRTLAELRGKSLLRATDEPWQPWFAQVGLNWPEPDHGLVYSDSGMLVQAAVEGQGIALARRSLVQDEITSGKLVQVFAQTLAHPWSCYLVTAQAPPHRPVLQTLIDWLIAEARLSFGDDLPNQDSRAPIPAP